MNNLAHKIGSDVFQELATVVSVAGASFTVRGDHGDYVAARAKSCLVAPEPGDLALVAVTRAGAAWLLAVLESARGDATRLELSGDLEVRLPRGKLTLAAEGEVNVLSATGVGVVSQRVDVNAAEGNFVLQKLSLLGRYLQSEVEKVKVFGSTFDAVLERVSQRVKRSYRTVEEYEQLRARQIDYVASGTLQLHADNTVMTANKLVKMDGEQIHVG